MAVEIVNQNQVGFILLATLFIGYFLASTFIMKMDITTIYFLMFGATLVTGSNPSLEHSLPWRFILALLISSATWRSGLKLFDMGAERGARRTKDQNPKPLFWILCMSVWIAFQGAIAGKVLYSFLDVLDEKMTIYYQKESDAEVLGRVIGSALVKFLL